MHTATPLTTARVHSGVHELRSDRRYRHAKPGCVNRCASFRQIFRPRNGDSVERIHPPQSRKPRHVGVGRVKLGLVFDCQGGKMRVRSQIPRSARRLEKTEQDVSVTNSGMYQHCLWLSEPRPDPRAGAHRVERIVEYPRAGGDANKSQDRDPWKTDAFRTVHQVFPPFSRRLVTAGQRIVGVHQQIDVRNDHRASCFASSSDSNSSTS